MLFVTCGTILADLNPERSATVQASYYLLRCTLSAAGVAALEALILSVGVGWCFTVFAALSAFCVPLLYVLRHCGQSWRQTDEAEIT